MNEGYQSGCRLTLVSAPAGFGKSTCVSEWVSGFDFPVSWLGLDPSDEIGFAMAAGKLKIGCRCAIVKPQVCGKFAESRPCVRRIAHHETAGPK